MPLTTTNAVVDTTSAVLELTPWAILTATAGLVAFHIGLYTLVGRERKSPYVINRAFPIFLICLCVATTSVSSTLLPTPYAEQALWISTFVLSIAFLYSLIVVSQVASRFIYFVDSVQIKNLWPFRAWKSRKIRSTARPTYEHNPTPLPIDLLKEIIDTLVRTKNDQFHIHNPTDPHSLAIGVINQEQANQLLSALAYSFLKRELYVQYLTASRHPIDFVLFLKDHLMRNGINWRDVDQHVVTIDAYSSHFAFTDSIYLRKSIELESLNVDSVTSSMTFAGIHSASSKAFNIIKSRDTDTRRPTLVIYENTHALTDLESTEQYRIFVRHVLPSEKLFGGMFTVFLESAQNDADWKLLRSYTSMQLDLRDTKTEITIPPPSSVQVITNVD